MAVTGNVTSVGRRIKLLREGMNLSLRDLAERSGVSAQMLSQVERGETSPTIAVAERIAAGLELTLSQLLRLDEGDGVNVVRTGERREAGSRETAVVTEGKLRLICDGAPYDLSEGDCVTFDADLPQHFENPGEADARFYAIVSAGLRRS